jgi:hypothetical protein
MRLQPCCLPLPCGTWPGSFSSAAPCVVEVKNNSMYECFAVFLRITEFAPPMSRRQVTNRRELLLPLLMPDRHQIGVVLDPALDPATTINGKASESPDAWIRHSTHCRSAKQISQTTEGVIAELIAGSQMFARLLFQRIRPLTQSGMIGDQDYSPHEFQESHAPSSDMATEFINCADVPVLAPIPPAIETLFTQLARRRLRKRATEEAR